MLAVIKFLR